MGFYIMTERGWQEIPKECSNHNSLEGIYRDTNHEIMVFLLLRRADRFCQALEDFHPIHHAHQFRGHEFVEPLVGAFGEKL